MALLALAKGVARGTAAKILGMHRAQSKTRQREEVLRLESVARGVGMPVVDCCPRPQNRQGNCRTCGDRSELVRLRHGQTKERTS